MSASIIPLVLEVETEGNLRETVTVSGIKVHAFGEAAIAVENGDEFRLIELACEKPRGWAQLLKPEHYSTLANAMHERAQDFFGFLARRTARKVMTDPESMRAIGAQ